MRAVVFDFFGTLTDPGVEVGRKAAYEATGAALALPIIEAAARMMCEMRTFAEAGVSTQA